MMLIMSMLKGPSFVVFRECFSTSRWPSVFSLIAGCNWISGGLKLDGLNFSTGVDYVLWFGSRRSCGFASSRRSCGFACSCRSCCRMFVCLQLQEPFGLQLQELFVCLQLQELFVCLQLQELFVCLQPQEPLVCQSQNLSHSLNLISLIFTPDFPFSSYSFQFLSWFFFLFLLFWSGMDGRPVIWVLTPIRLPLRWNSGNGFHPEVPLE